jgi:integrase
MPQNGQYTNRTFFWELMVSKRRTKGEGSIYYNDGIDRWVAQITLPNGQRKSKSSKVQKDVRDWLIVQRNKLRAGLYVTDDQMKLGDFLDRYMEDVAKHSLRPRTYERNYDLVNNHIKPDLGNIKLNTLRPDQVQTFYTKKLNEGLSKRTVQYIHAVLHKALKQALKWGLVTRNVTDLVEKPRPKRKTFTTWSADEVNQFLEAVSDHRWYPIYALAVYTGMRQGEILGLHREDINLKKGVINVRHQVSAIRGQGLVITEPKSEKARRPITLSQSVIDILKSHLELIDEGPGLVFTTSTGRPISPRNVLRHFKGVIEKSGLPEIRFHDLRHTHATLLLAAGVHPKVVQERLGHSQISLTLDTYSHVIPSLQTEAADQFETILG